MWNYLMSVLIYVIVIKSSIYIGKFLLKNGRLKKIREFNKGGEAPSVLITSCIPIFRLIIVIGIFYICFCSDEQFEKIIKKD